MTSQERQRLLEELESELYRAVALADGQPYQGQWGQTALDGLPNISNLHGLRIPTIVAREYFYENWDRPTIIFQADCRQIRLPDRNVGNPYSRTTSASNETILDYIRFFDERNNLFYDYMNKWFEVFGDQRYIRQNTVYNTYISKYYIDFGQPGAMSNVVTDPEEKVSPFFFEVPLALGD